MRRYARRGGAAKTPAIAVVIGTRPEAIKLAPVVMELQKSGVDHVVITTGQHAELVDQVLDLFEIRVWRDLAIMRPNQTLDYVLSSVLTGVGAALDDRPISAVVVQGDTTSALAGALAAFHRRIPVAHVEAGLRSRNLDYPFPEEFNRRAVSVLATWNFAPTEHAAANLRDDGHRRHVSVTGNTVVDAVRHVSRLRSAVNTRVGDFVADRPYFLVTAHRRESWGEPIREIAEAIRELLGRFPSYRAVVVRHPNPAARGPIDAVLNGEAGVLLLDALEYPTFIDLLRGSSLAISDSGGVQEEGPALGVPVLVTRDTTERPEGVLAGAAALVGTDTTRIVTAASDLLSDTSRLARMASAGLNLYGDGFAAQRIVRELLAVRVAAPRIPELRAPTPELVF